MNANDLRELQKRFPLSASTLAKNCYDRVAPGPVGERSVGNEPVAEIAGENPCPTKCVVRITSFRSRLIDGDNLHGKAFVDALQTAGAIYKDSPEWCKVEVKQVQVENPWQQRTVIEIFELG